MNFVEKGITYHPEEMDKMPLTRKEKVEFLQKLEGVKLIKKAHQIRSQVVSICTKNGAGHIAPSLSCIDILVALYYNIMNLSVSPKWEGRDRLVFSKAHGCYGLYGILADICYLDKSAWKSFYQGSYLSGCSERDVKHGLEAGCGSLGHGLPMAVGISFGASLQKLKYRVYCIVGDGEMQEGSNWEAVQFAVKHRLSNLTVIIDNNRLQAMDFLETILTPKGRSDDLQRKFEAFGFITEKCDGHNGKEIINSINKWDKTWNKLDAPQLLIADTIKGYGLFCMENNPDFHFRLPTSDELKMGNRFDEKNYKLSQ